MVPDARAVPPPESFVLITSTTNEAAVQVLMLLLANHLRVKRDFWVDPIPAYPPFIVRLNPDLPVATLATLRAAVDGIPDVVMG
jgi:hypothetical protein